MVHLLIAAAAALATTCIFGSVSALNPITIKGSKFFDSATGDQFFIKGVAYQPRSHTTGFSDPLSKPDDCKRDASLMKSLGLNTIRVYQVDPSLNHDECMATFESVGIYLILDLTVPKYSIVRNNPEYDINIWNQVRDTIDTFKGYRNILGFFAGNEVTNDKSTTMASAYVKALLRDIKTHISSTSPRRIPVGYANNDDPDVRLQIQAYFNCGKEEERADFYGINLYEWCGTDVDYQTSGYADRTKEVATYSVPVFLSEFGCNTVLPRTFTEVQAIFGPNMTSTWSGGIVYEWSEEDNRYGLVNINSDNTAKPLADYDYLQKTLASVHPKGVRMDAFKEERSISTCPANTDMWEPNAHLPPTPSAGACECMMSSLNCVASDQAVATTENLGTLLNTICGMASCDDITSNGKTGVYGKYSFCAPAQKLSYMYNFYHVNMGKKQPTSCSFNGMAKLTTASKSSDKECMAIKDPLLGPKTGSNSAGWAITYNLVLVGLTALTASMLNF
ncbi:1,3-beta-glucanosyltransferase gas1 [Mortierella polycephala]|uniref:1,3-beta-glucanosyltransferase n=1 Tax=Mortierella polycephala TaxID=41804 RepID=A0A9P6PTI6_9FUNG|nr:1,3-beta-glucanosyltransferase gas1 [Mortierella polycephala]